MAENYFEKLAFEYSPPWLKDIAVTYRSCKLFRMRRGNVYHSKTADYLDLMKRPYNEMKEYQIKKFREIFEYAKNNSLYYSRKYDGVNGDLINEVPILEKEELRNNIDDIVIGDKSKMIAAFTGGTMGKGLILYLSKKSMQSRIAMLDIFWQMHGYKPGRDKIAWFSGRNLVSSSDIKKHVFWRNNYLLKIRYYSTFHIGLKTLDYYIENLNRFRPAYITGFPASVYEVAHYMETKGIHPEFTLKAVFATSETVQPEYRRSIEKVFGCKLWDQYGAAEGPPFIFQCSYGRYHVAVASGMLEIIDDQGKPSNEGHAIITSFYMYDTPIIRYRIGDHMRVSEKIDCDCGWQTPIVEELKGRTGNYLEIPGRGKIWSVQIGDCVKGITSIVSLQAMMVNNEKLRIFLVADPDQFEKKDKQLFLEHLEERIGKFPVEIEYVSQVRRTAGGKTPLILRSEELV